MFSPNRLLTPKEQALLLGVAVAVLVGSGVLYWSARRGAAVQETAVAIAPAPAVPASQPVDKPAPKSPVAAVPPSPVLSATPPAGEPTTMSAASAAGMSPAPAPPAEIAVAVRGGVRREGLYRLPSDSRVADVIMKAGGATVEADLSEINLAARLMDGTTLTVPVGARISEQDGRITGRGSQHRAAANPASYLAGMAVPESTGPTPGLGAAAKAAASAASDTAVSGGQSKTGTASGNGLINLNTATQTELETLPGIGSVLASHIIEQRQMQPFKTVDELDNVPGIGEKRLEAVRSLVTVE